MKNFLVFLAVLLVLSGLGFWWYFANNKGVESAQNYSTNQSEETKEEEKKVSNLQFPGVLEKERIENKKALIATAKGEIEFELYADRAPKTVSNFVYLAEQGYFDGLKFHRVVPGFVIQGGDPTGSGAGGPGYKFPDEPVVGDYLEGTVAMANAGPNTNGSQFFICLEDLPTLPKQYNLFGQVTRGIEVVKSITQGDKMDKVTILDK
jgi:cyclophilin family peptidyl-prolyl cis-trans isomerase